MLELTEDTPDERFQKALADGEEIIARGGRPNIAGLGKLWRINLKTKEKESGVWTISLDYNLDSPFVRLREIEVTIEGQQPMMVGTGPADSLGGLVGMAYVSEVYMSEKTHAHSLTNEPGDYDKIYDLVSFDPFQGKLVVRRKSAA
jgi:hypothetical protein